MGAGHGGAEATAGSLAPDVRLAHPRRAGNPHCARLIEVAHQIAQRLPDPDIAAAFLFGSAAWGDADAASDLDIMVLLDRPPRFREVTRRRASDLLGLELPGGPRFVDLDRFSMQEFEELAPRGVLIFRLAHCVILKDKDGLLSRLREEATTALTQPEGRAARFRQKQTAAENARAAARRALAAGDAPLAALTSRIAVQEAVGALIDLDHDRVSVTHFVESATNALESLGRGELAAPFLRAFAIDAPPEGLLRGIARSQSAYRVLAAALKRWMDDPALASGLSEEDVAWAIFTWCDETYEEIAHKVETFTALGRLQTLLYYLDGLLTVPMRINFGKLFRLRATGESGRLTTAEFHEALRSEPALLAEWIEALRLERSPQDIQEADALAGELLAAGAAALGLDA